MLDTEIYLSPGLLVFNMTLLSVEARQLSGEMHLRSGGVFLPCLSNYKTCAQI